MIVFSNVRIPVFGVGSDPAVWVDPPMSVSPGVYFRDEDWLKPTNATRLQGVVEGIARSVDYNTVMRQCSVMSMLFANILAYRNSLTRAGQSTPYGGSSSAPIGADLFGVEIDMNAHIGALSNIFDSTNFLADNEVTTRTINALAVTTAKLQNSTGLTDGVTTGKIATDAITRAKLGSDLILTGSATNNGITITLGQGATSGNRGLVIGFTGTAKPNTAGTADLASQAQTIDTAVTTGAFYLTGTSNASAGVAQSLIRSQSVYVSGGNQVVANSFNATSDERLKENIEEVGHNQTKALVEGVKVKTFNFKKRPKETFVGVTAQDILAQNTVLGDTLVRKEGKGKKEILTIQESKLVYVLWDYIQQLEKRVKELEGK